MKHQIYIKPLLAYIFYSSILSLKYSWVEIRTSTLSHYIKIITIINKNAPKCLIVFICCLAETVHLITAPGFSPIITYNTPDTHQTSTTIFVPLTPAFNLAKAGFKPSSQPSLTWMHGFGTTEPGFRAVLQLFVETLVYVLIPYRLSYRREIKRDHVISNRWVV